MTDEELAALLNATRMLGYHDIFKWKVQPTRKARLLKKRGIGVGVLDGDAFEGEMLFDPWDEDRELVRTLKKHGVEVWYDGEEVDSE
jgi:hypothetical protein